MRSVMKLVAVAGVMGILGAMGSFGEEDGDVSKVKLTPSGFASYNIGQVVHGNPISTMHAGIGNPVVDYALMQRIFIGFNLQASYSPLPITSNIAVEMKMYNQVPREQNTWMDLGQSQRAFYLPYISRADVVYTPFETFSLDAGYFPFKYNEDTRNLGEYLFRSGTYPQYLITNFDFAAARLAGIRASGTLFKDLHLDAILNTNTEYSTIGDLNLTGIFSYDILNKFLTIGGGVSFCSFISAGKNHTSPDNNTNPNAVWVKGVTSRLDTSNITVYDTSYGHYTFAGTKLMGRACFDPKVLMPSVQIFGKEDLKLYAEVAVLGVKNYPKSLGGYYYVPDTTNAPNDSVFVSVTRYNDILKRMPIMFGINIPTFKLLDVLNLEWEWFNSPYPNDMETVYMDGLPVAQKSYMSGYKSIYADSTNDNWKWSLYAKKTLSKNFQIVFQVASDHFRWEYADYGRQAQLQSEAFTKMGNIFRDRGHYYYMLKLGYNF